MRTMIKTILIALLSIGVGATAFAQAKEIRVLLANHPYGEVLKAAIPEFEKTTGIKVNVESLQESQLTQKLTTEFATSSSSVDVFMTRPLQEAKLFNKNGWYESLAAYDFSDYPKNAVSSGTFGGTPYVVPLVTTYTIRMESSPLLKNLQPRSKVFPGC